MSVRFIFFGYGFVVLGFGALGFLRLWWFLGFLHEGLNVLVRVLGFRVWRF